MCPSVQLATAFVTGPRVVLHDNPVRVQLAHVINIYCDIFERAQFDFPCFKFKLNDSYD